jgi:16S rRNA (guanine1207-N2)-methyltransferase
MDNRSAIAFYPFETGLIGMPGPGARVLVINAVPGMRTPAGFDAELSLAQDMRPAFLPLKASGHHIKPTPEGMNYDLAIVLAGRYRRQNEAWVAEALARTRTGGQVLVAGSKTDGIASLRKRLGVLAPLDGAESKFHGMAFWLTRPDDAIAAIEALTPAARELVETRYVTGPGMFSADGVDPGSRLLADNLPAGLKGSAADFGAGWGYLSARLAESESIRSLDLYEASHTALKAATANMTAVARPSLACRYLWHDLLTEQVAERYDVIVMNPPFHQGRAAEPEIGITMIGAATGALKKGGRLFMVANRGLPYEAVLQAGTSSHGNLIEDARYRVLWARK